MKHKNKESLQNTKKHQCNLKTSIFASLLLRFYGVEPQQWDIVSITIQIRIIGEHNITEQAKQKCYARLEPLLLSVGCIPTFLPLYPGTKAICEQPGAGEIHTVNT